ncbi:MAG: hypothetical protein DRI61_13475 [Chloroflexi bacterium]|nr:MAG: hypothetical protein DRI61_13475 [Chloroflexota bacterium]
MKESPIFLKTHDMLVWLLEHTTKFPKSQRFVMTKRVEESALNFYDLLVAAVKDGKPLRRHVRLCRDLRLLSVGQCEHLCRMLVEIGKLLGAWIVRSRGSGPKGQAGSSWRLVEQRTEGLSHSLPRPVPP